MPVFPIPSRIVGLASVTFRALPPEEVLALARAAGLRAIEWGADVHAPPDLPPARLREIGRLTREAGLAVVGYGTYHRLGVSPAAERPALYAAARALGAPRLRVWAGAKGSAEATPEEVRRVHAAAAETVREAASEGLEISTECHPATLTDAPESALALLAAAPALFTHWQPRPDFGEDWNAAYLAAVRDRVRIAHVFAWRGRPGGGAPERFPLADHAAAGRRYLSLLPPAAPRLLEFLPGDDPAALAREAETLRDLTTARP